MNMPFHAALLALLFPQEEIIFEHPANANPVVKTVEGRCGPNVYRIIFLTSADANLQRLSFSVNNIEVPPIELSKFSKIIGYSYIENVEFKQCIRREGILNGVRMLVFVSAERDRKMIVVDIVDGKIHPETPGKSLIN